MGVQRLISVFLLAVHADCFNNVVVRQTIESDLLPRCIYGPGTTQFYLYNRYHPHGTILGVKTEHCKMRVRKPVWVFIHGFTANPFSIRWLTLMRCLIHKFGMNVIIVDWRDGSCTKGGNTITKYLSYPFAVKNVEPVGVTVANFLIHLNIVCGVDLTRVNIIGHSLGSHLGSFCAKYLWKRRNVLMKRFWSLDPAGLMYNSRPCQERTCTTDAHCVLVFHSSSTYGSRKPMGQYDMYFNGGNDQPGCQNVALTNRFLCSHTASIEYLTHIFCGPECAYLAEEWDMSDPPPWRFQCAAGACFPLGIATGCRPSFSGTYYVDTTKLSNQCVSFAQPYPIGLGLV